MFSMNLSLIKVEEDVKIFKSVKTGRGPLEEGWREDSKPIMCRYKHIARYPSERKRTPNVNIRKDVDLWEGHAVNLRSPTKSN